MAQPTNNGGEKPDNGARARTPEPTTAQRIWQELTASNATLTALSVLLALVIGGLLIVVSDPEVQGPAGYFFSRPMDTLQAAWTSASSAYAAMFQGSVIDFSEYTVARALRPLADTLTNAAPLIAAGLAVAIAFRTGLLNIGAEGQIILGAIFAGYVGFALDLPPVIHLVAALLAAIIGGALWGGIAGLLKAQTGAHEVIVTIMLNYIARFLLAYLLTTEVFRRAGRADPISPFVADTAELPRFIEGERLHLGFLIALIAAAFVWWLLSRSTTGFRFRAVGFNPNAAHTAGISVARSYTAVMFIAGGLAGLAGASQVLGTERFLTTGISGGLGFDAITVALLGRSGPWGTVAAGLLFGALRSGAVTMQARTGTPIDIVLVVQSMIVLFIAAPPLVRAVFRLKVRPVGQVAPAARGWDA
ncbi:MAG: ABC transporter permease [Pseudonocardiaceae bacterium]